MEERKGLTGGLSEETLELRIRFSVRKEPEKGWDRGLEREVVLVEVMLSGMVSLGWEVEREEMRGGREEGG